MWIGWIEFDILLGDVHTVKEKRSVVRPLIAQIRHKHDVSVAEVEHQNLYRRAGVGVGLVAADRAHAVRVLDTVEQFVAMQPQLELLAARRRIISSDD